MKKVRIVILLVAVLLTADSAFSWERVDHESVSEVVYPKIDLFEVHQAEIRSVLRQLSEHGGVDIVVGDDITGTVSMNVTDKTWREILSIVCRVKNLVPLVEENYIYIISHRQYQERKVGQAAISEALETASPLKREIIRLNFTTARTILPVINSLLSTRGRAINSDHANSIVVHDTEENIKQIRSVINDLDVQSPQVSITCKIIEVSSGMVRQMGVHWGVTDQQYNLEARQLNPDRLVSGEVLNRITYGILTPERLGVALEYLFEDNESKIVAQPQITTLDNEQARVFMGQQVPIPLRDEAGNTVYQMVNAGTELIVTPHVSGNNKILLDLNPRKESYVRSPDGQPIINEQSASTRVFVNNGETVVIAGLTSNESMQAEVGIPILKNIPLLGALFKRSIKQAEKKDLIIFVTPQIIHPDI